VIEGEAQATNGRPPVVPSEKIEVSAAGAPGAKPCQAADEHEVRCLRGSGQGAAGENRQDDDATHATTIVARARPRGGVPCARFRCHSRFAGVV